MLVGGHEQPVIGRIVHAHLVVKVGVGPHARQLQLIDYPALVNPHQLLVQVIERGAGRPQPVLEDGDVAHPPVGLVQGLRRVHRQARVGAVLSGGQRPRTGQCGGVGGGVSEVTAGDDDVVTAGKEGGEITALLGRAHGLPELWVLAGGAQLGAGHGGHVRGSLGLGQVGLHALAGGVGNLVAVVGVPVVEGEDLKEIGDAAELGHGIEQPAGWHAVQPLKGRRRHPAAGCLAAAGHHAFLLRRSLQVAVAAEGARGGAVVLGEGTYLLDRVGDRAVAASRNRPHLGSCEGTDLLDGPVRQLGQRSGFGGVGHETSHGLILALRPRSGCAARRLLPAGRRRRP